MKTEARATTGISSDLVSGNLSFNLRKALFNLLRDYKDIFAWTYAEMTGADPQLGHASN